MILKIPILSAQKATKGLTKSCPLCYYLPDQGSELHCAEIIIFSISIDKLGISHAEEW